MSNETSNKTTTDIIDQIAKIELESLTKHQSADIHGYDTGEDVSSMFAVEFNKSTWYSSMPIKLKQSTDGGAIIYEAPNTFHYIQYSYMRASLPAISVKKEYRNKVRIAWTHNVGTNIISECSFRHEADVYHTMDSVWFDMHNQYYQRPGAGKRRNENKGMGNVDYLEKWQSELPAYPLNVDLPWFYSLNETTAFPLLYKQEVGKFTHRFIFRRKIVDLLRVQFFTNEGWTSSNNTDYSQFIDIQSNDKENIPIPEIWARCATITNPEVASWKQCGDGRRRIYTRDVLSFKSLNPGQYGANVEVSLNTKSPVLAMFWAAENQSALRKNCRSNYTTDINDVYAGWDPIIDHTFAYGPDKRFDKMASDHFNISESRHHFKSAPEENGYHAYSFSWDSSDYDADVGIVMGSNLKSASDAKLICSLADGDIFKSNIDTKLETIKPEDLLDPDNTDNNKIAPLKREDVKSTTVVSPDFTLQVRLYVMRHYDIIMSTNKPGQEYNFVLDA